jgi:hypothetical protein
MSTYQSTPEAYYLGSAAVPTLKRFEEILDIFFAIGQKDWSEYFLLGNMHSLPGLFKEKNHLCQYFYPELRNL